MLEIQEEKRTSFLLKKRSFLSGLGSVIDVFGEVNMFNSSKSAEEADQKAIRNDWDMVGSDFKKIMDESLKTL